MPKQELHGSARIFGYVNNTAQPLAENVFHPHGSTAVLLGINPQNNAERNARNIERGLIDPGRGLFWNLASKRGHGLCFSTTGGGKNTNLITPALLSYCGSVLCLDPKGENAWITANRRRQLGQKVVILDPWDQVNKVYGSKVGAGETISRFNPLASLDPRAPDFNEDVTAIADGIIIASDREPHWTDSATQLISGLIAAVVERAPGVGSFRDVRRLITASDGELLKIIELIVKRNPDSLATRKLRRFSNAASREIQSIRSTAETQTSIFDAVRLLDSLDNVTGQERTRATMLDAAQMLGTMDTSRAADTFDLAELATGRVTLFLVLPFGMLASHGRWMRLILQLALKSIARQHTPPDPPVLFLLDELGTINPGGGLRMIEQAYGLLGGMGVRIWGFFQTLDQLQRDYPSTWQTFIGNSEIINVMRVNDSNTAEYFSKKLGTRTVTANNGQVIGARPLLLPYEIEQLPQDDVITFMSGGGAYHMRSVPYYKEPRLRGLYRANPLFGAAANPAPASSTGTGGFLKRLAAVFNPAPAPASIVAQSMPPPLPAAPAPAAVVASAPVMVQPAPVPAPETPVSSPTEPARPFVMNGANPYAVSINLSIGKGKS